MDPWRKRAAPAKLPSILGKPPPVTILPTAGAIHPQTSGRSGGRRYQINSDPSILPLEDRLVHQQMVIDDLVHETDRLSVADESMQKEMEKVTVNQEILTGEVNSLLTRDKILQQKISDLTSTDELLKKEISLLAETDESLKKEISELHRTDGSLKQEISNLGLTDESLKKEIFNLTGVKNSLQNQISHLAKTDEEIKKDVSNFLATFSASMDEREAGIRGQLSQVQRDFSDKHWKLFQRLNYLSNEVENLQSSDGTRAKADAGPAFQSNLQKEQLKNAVKELGIEDIQQSEHCAKEREMRLKYSTVPKNVIYLIGGFNGTLWSTSLDSFLPKADMLMPCKSMTSGRSHSSAAALNDNIYVVGGEDDNTCLNTVECYSQRNDEWTLCSPLIRAKGSLASATLNGKIFALGGGSGSDCFSDVEMFDPALGRWIYNQSMLQKRYALAAAELHGVLYAVGGHDGQSYLHDWIMELFQDSEQIGNVPFHSSCPNK